MTALTLLALTLALLPYPSLAQDSPECAPLAPILAYNASSTLPIPALSVAWLGDTDDNNILINNDTRAEWQLSAYVQPNPFPGAESERYSTRTALWLDTGDTNATRLGDTMRMCHNYVPIQKSSGEVSWSRQVLKRSVDDTGDCRKLVSEECLARLQVQYGLQAQAQRGSGYNGCGEANNTVPWECEGSGMVAPVTVPNPTFNGTLRSRLPVFATANAPLNTTSPLVCEGRNLSRSTATLASTQDYELGVTFPIMDIMTFFGTAGTGSNFRADSFRVHIACLVPGSVAEGSEEKGSVESVLKMYNITGGGDESGAQALGRGRAVWAAGAWAVVVGAVLVV